MKLLILLVVVLGLVAAVQLSKSLPALHFTAWKAGRRDLRGGQPHERRALARFHGVFLCRVYRFVGSLW